MSLLYRASQFWKHLVSAPKAEDLVDVERILSPALMGLFSKMLPNEQAHSLQVFHLLVEEGEGSQDLLTAALLHDVGKSCHPLSPWERVLIVLGNVLAPRWVERWGQGEPLGWKRPFVVAVMHPDWGAEMAREAGASALTVSLIRRHQRTSVEIDPMEGSLLKRLQRVDNES